MADAVEKGDKAALRTLLLVKTDVNAAQVDGTTALHWAVYRNDAAVVDQLIKAGAKVGAKNREGITPLYMAAIYGDPTIVGALLKAGANAKELGPNGETTLMLAARNGNPAVVKQLIAAGVDLNTKEPLARHHRTDVGGRAISPRGRQGVARCRRRLEDPNQWSGNEPPLCDGCGRQQRHHRCKKPVRIQQETGVSIEDQIKAAAAAGGGGRGGNNRGRRTRTRQRRKPAISGRRWQQRGVAVARQGRPGRQSGSRRTRAAIRPRGRSGCGYGRKCRCSCR